MLEAKISAIENIFGLLNELTPEQRRIFDESVERRSLMTCNPLHETDITVHIGEKSFTLTICEARALHAELAKLFLPPYRAGGPVHD